MGHLDSAPAALSAGVFGAHLTELRTEWTQEQRDLPATLPPNVAVSVALCTHTVKTGLPRMSNRYALFLPTPKSINKSGLIKEMAG